MAQGDVTIFEEFSKDLGNKVHNLGSDTFYIGLIDNTAAPTAADATPRWADYSGNEVSTAGGYTAGGEDVTASVAPYAEANGVGTFKLTSITIAQNGSGFEDAYWGIVYNGTASNDEAVGFVDLGGPVSEKAGAVEIKFDGASSGSEGAFLTVTVDNS